MGLRVVCEIEPPPSLPSQAADPDRRAAEWVLGIGGMLRLLVNGDERQVRAMKELPREQFVITWIHLYEAASVDDLGIKNLSGLTRLESLNLGHTEVSDIGAIKGLTRLTELNLTGTKVTPSVIASLQAALPNCKIIVDLQ